MDATRFTIGLEISLVLVILYLLDRNFFHYVDLTLQYVRTRVSLQVYQRVLGIRLWFDRQAVIHRGPVGRLWNAYCLWRIRTNPAYREFFENKPDPLPKGED